MSDVSHLSRYRPAVFAITGVAAACGIYILYSTYADQAPKTALHRSNAIHRGRSERPPPLEVTFAHPLRDAPLGNLNIGSEPIRWNLYTRRQPTVEATYGTIGLTPNQVLAIQSEMNRVAIQCVLHACFLARPPIRRRQLDELGLDGLCEAMAAHDVDGIRRHSSEIALVLTMVSTEEIDPAVEIFIDGPLFRGSEVSSSGDSEIYWAETERLEDDNAEPSQGLKGLLYHIAENEAKRKAYEHRGIHCEGCGERPIRGVRWHCLNCPDFDLCSTCEMDHDHIKTHVFAKIKIPLPVLSQPTKECALWYPGDPRKMHSPLKSHVKRRLQDEYNLDGPQIDALYDQFTCIANMPWAVDPAEIKAAIDRRAFNKALTSERWPQRFRPNAVYDRMFAFYDMNDDSLIGFEEFVCGLAYLRGSKRFTPLSRALEGFDIDGDGYVERKDFIRLFRAKHEIHKMIIEDMIQCHEMDHTRSAMDTLRSSQPISAIFSMDEIPQGEERPPQGKVLRNGDMELEPGTKTILEDNEGWTEDDRPLDRRRSRIHARRRPHERLQEHLSRFEEMLDSPTEETNGIRVHITDELAGVSTQHGESPNETSDPELQKRQPSHTPPADGSESDDSDGPLNQDVLWQFVENGFHEMLDPLFQRKEQEDQEVADTHEERQKWRREIAEIAGERREAKETKLRFEDIENAALVDPLVATAMTSEVRRPMVRRGNEGITTFVPGPFVPTDAESLTRREEEISRRPLEELLAVTGYWRVGGDRRNGLDAARGEHHPPGPNGTSLNTEASDLSSETEHNARETRTSEPPAVSIQEAPPDPTMPQNRPNSSMSPPMNAGPAPDNELDALKSSEEPEEPPSRERLEHLCVLDQKERQIKLRGGPGRLSYDEVEELVKSDPSRELRGLVTSWLEWASF